MAANHRIVDDIFLLKQRCMYKIEDLCTETGLVPREMAAIESLEPGERVSGNEISRRMELSPSRGSRVVERLIRKDYLVRESDPHDRRVVLLFLSERGVEQKRKIDMLKDDCEHLLRSQIPEEQITVVRQGMEILLKAL
ncbi:MAG: MarR family winged helix-turn-helix transcriptional regulator [Candidatus Latescibacterota bacterium]